MRHMPAPEVALCFELMPGVSWGREPAERIRESTRMTQPSGNMRCTAELLSHRPDRGRCRRDHAGAARLVLVARRNLQRDPACHRGGAVSQLVGLPAASDLRRGEATARGGRHAAACPCRGPRRPMARRAWSRHRPRPSPWRRLAADGRCSGRRSSGWRGDARARFGQLRTPAAAMPAADPPPRDDRAAAGIDACRGQPCRQLGQAVEGPAGPGRARERARILEVPGRRHVGAGDGGARADSRRTSRRSSAPRATAVPTI